MRVLLRNRNTQLYINLEGEWTPAREQAQDFRRDLAALRYAVDQKLRNLEIVFAFDNPQHDITIPVERQSAALHSANGPSGSVSE